MCACAFQYACKCALILSYAFSMPFLTFVPLYLPVRERVRICVCRSRHACIHMHVRAYVRACVFAPSLSCVRACWPLLPRAFVRACLRACVGLTTVEGISYFEFLRPFSTAAFVVGKYVPSSITAHQLCVERVHRPQICFLIAG